MIDLGMGVISGIRVICHLEFGTQICKIKKPSLRWKCLAATSDSGRSQEPARELAQFRYDSKKYIPK